MKSYQNDEKPEGFPEDKWQAYLERKRLRAEHLAAHPPPTTVEEVSANIPKHLAEEDAEIAEFKKKHGIP